MNNETTAHDSYTEFQNMRKDYKRKMRKRILLIGGGVLIVVIAFTLIILTVLRKSDAHLAAEQYISANAEIQAKTGGIKDFGMFPTGNLQISNGYGNADLNISVNGTKHDLDVFVHLEKEPNGEWQVLQMEAE